MSRFKFKNKEANTETKYKSLNASVRELIFSVTSGFQGPRLLY